MTATQWGGRRPDSPGDCSIEHIAKQEVIKTADWILDLGPEGGDKGGEVVAEGTPEEVAATEGSYTGEYLAGMLGKAEAAE